MRTCDLRKYCIDTPGVKESSDSSIINWGFSIKNYQSIQNPHFEILLVMQVHTIVYHANPCEDWMNSGPLRAASDNMNTKA